jgi:hypothetical protein
MRNAVILGTLFVCTLLIFPCHAQKKKRSRRIKRPPLVLVAEKIIQGQRFTIDSKQKTAITLKALQAQFTVVF